MTETPIKHMTAQELFGHLSVAQIERRVMSLDELDTVNDWLNGYFAHISPGLEKETNEYCLLENLFREHLHAAVLMTDQDLGQNDASGALDALLRKGGA